MRVFLDSSVLLAAAGTAKGSCRSLFRLSKSRGWVLLSSPYAVHEVHRNLPKLSLDATHDWLVLRSQIVLVDDIVTVDRPAIFTAEKDRPILFTALANADVLLTLDKNDFAELIGSTFYGLSVQLPYVFIARERDMRTD